MSDKKNESKIEVKHFKVLPMKGEKKRKEGWTWLTNSRKWHYFRNGMSLCGKFAILSDNALEQGNNNSPDNCAACKKKLKGEQDK